MVLFDLLRNLRIVARRQSLPANYPRIPSSVSTESNSVLLIPLAAVSVPSTVFRILIYSLEPRGKGNTESESR